MRCRKIAKQLPAYLANELSERFRGRVDAHLKHCALCRAELGAFERTDQLLGTIGEVEPRRDLVRLAVRHIEREQETIPAFKRFLISLRTRRTQLQYAAANVLLVLALAVMLYNYQARRHSTLAQVPTTNERAAILTETGKGGGPVPDFVGPVKWIRGWVLRPIQQASTGGRPSRERIVVPLTLDQIAKFNEEFEHTRSGAAGNEFTAAPEPDGGVLRVTTPTVLVPDSKGSILVKPRTEAARQPTNE